MFFSSEAALELSMLDKATKSFASESCPLLFMSMPELSSKLPLVSNIFATF